jgi:hypothetical protein
MEEVVDRFREVEVSDRKIIAREIMPCFNHQRVSVPAYVFFLSQEKQFPSYA